MCGLVGVYNLNGSPVSLPLLKRMANKISYRGQDGEGYFNEGGMALGHKRLAILDVSEKGSQPMTSKSRNWVIVFNGAIYNFLELKEELKSLGSIFISKSDTEVIVEGINSFGIDFIKKFNGMFAIAAYNRISHDLYLCRDRYGIKPLYYWFNGKSIVFASEIKSIIEHPEYPKGIDLHALNEYFTFQNLFTYNTLFEGIKMLPPANIIKINPDTKEIRHNPWWDYDFSNPDESISFEDARIETKRLFENAVKRQMISDVPVGSYLSGGIDSGSITAVASKHVKRLSTFTCGFDMNEVTGVEANYDERKEAELIANHFKTEHFEQVINAGDLSWSLPRVVYHLEDLRVGMCYANYYISRLASRFVKVALQGTGGDELYGGYPWRYYKIFRSLNQSDFFNQYYEFWQRLVADNLKHSLFNTSILKRIDICEPRRIFERVFTFNEKLKYKTPEDHIQNSLYFEIKTFLPGLLILGDKLSMANSLEERFPFLDNDLVNFAQKIPVRHKLGNLTNEIKRIDENIPQKKRFYEEYNDGKDVLRQAMKDFIPKTILNRKKQGFSSPDESWLRGENANYVKSVLLSRKTVSSDYINRSFVSEIINEHNSGKKNYRLLIWSFLNFELWCKIFLDNQKIDDL
jgi:asparagine synthase (glutamine-hydrolysing)